MSAPIWTPTVEFIEQTHLHRFMANLKTQHQVELADYPALYDWSIAHPALFWEAFWQFAEIKTNSPYHSVLEKSNHMQNTHWFSGAKLNFADNLLRHRTDDIAIIEVKEPGQTTTLTYQTLAQQVASLAAVLRKQGVSIGDRVAGIVPNCSATIIAMLATTSIGAIWSSCSPDFGAQALIDRLEQITPKVLFAVDGYWYQGKTIDITAKIKTVVTALTSVQTTVLVPYLNCEHSKSAEISSPNSFLFNDLINDTISDCQFEFLPFEHPAFILYSSGTTGKPKCIVHSAGGTLLQHLKELMLHTDLHARDVFCFFTTCGWMMWNWMVSSLALGVTLLLYDGSPFYPVPERMIDLVAYYRVNVFGTSAKYLSALEKFGVKPRVQHDLGQLKCILSTGSPLLPEQYDYVYQSVSPHVRLCSISGGTDIISCFALGNPILPIYRGELQSRGLGLAVNVYNEQGQPVVGEKGELVCTAPFPSMPISFWNDPTFEKYHHSYFSKFPGIWAHGDYAELTAHHGVIIYGRSDTVLNPGGVRIGTAEIYRQVETIKEIVESIVVDQQWQNDTRIILFVKLQSGLILDEVLRQKIRTTLKNNASPRHVPAKILQVNDIPRTISGKIVELAVRHVIHGQPVTNLDALANPESLTQFANRSELNTP